MSKGVIELLSHHDDRASRIVSAFIVGRGWFVISCSPRLCRGEHVELFEKLKGEILKQR